MSRHGGIHTLGTSSSGSYDSSRKANGSSQGSGTRGYPHVKDLVARGVTDVNSYMPLPKLLRTAELSAKQADNFLDFRRPDLAFTEYIRASHIVSEVIPVHKDAPSLHSGQIGGSSDWASLWRLNRELIKKIDSQHTKFDAVRDIIAQDNARSGVLPKLPPVSSPPKSRPSSRPQSVQGYYVNGDGAIPSPDGRTYSLPQRQSIGAAAELRSGRATPTALGGPAMATTPPRRSPFNTESPENLLRRSPVHNASSIAMSPAKSSTDGLAERFAKLRTSSSSNPSQTSQLRNLTLDSSSPAAGFKNLGISSPVVRMPSPSQFTGGPKFPQPNGSTIPNGSASHSGPHGPRDPSKPFFVPPAPPKIPLNTQIASTLPRAPSPTYSPARNLPAPAHINPPRTTARSLVSSGRRPESIAVSGTTPNGGQILGQTAATSTGFEPGRVPQRKPVSSSSAPITEDSSISPEQLGYYLKHYTVLLVDIRGREEFDQGHIFATSVICIEPTSLRVNMSAEELEERLVISPESEQRLFENRDTYDLIVYYDQKTKTTDFLRRPSLTNETTWLKTFYTAMTEFSIEKTLIRPPKLLLGGLNAWSDFVGPQTLATSETFAPGARNSTPSARITGSTSSLQPKKRRVRGYTAGNFEDQEYWLQKARKESHSWEQKKLPTVGPENGNDAAEDDDDFSMVHTYEEFHRRYPEAENLQQSMISAAPRTVAPIPQYPNQTSSSLPRPPSRPAPAAPRTSYSGVSERALAAQSNLPGHGSQASAAPLYSTSAGPPAFRENLPRSGLYNFGVTCYINSTIQCLNATIPLARYFLMNKHRNSLQSYNARGTNGILPEYFANLVTSMWNHKGIDQSLKSFYEFASRENVEWGKNKQQDAKEFLEFLLDCLHEDLNINSNRQVLDPLKPAEEERREKLPMVVASKPEWNRYIHRNYSYISSLFAGQHASRVRCKTCSATSTTYEAFWSISVEIPSSGSGKLQECLRSYFQEENLSGGAIWKCPRCKCRREATKRIIMTRAPHFLIVHFKRFATTLTGSTRKVHTPIEFPLYGLNLDQFAAPAPTPEDYKQMMKYGYDASPHSDWATQPPYNYEAYAVLRHHGSSMNVGHYTAVAKDTGRGCWRVFDDNSSPVDLDPRKFAADDKVKAEAYIVLYMRTSAR